MYDCFFDKVVKTACPKSCNRVIYKGFGYPAKGFPTEANMMSIATKFSTMDVDYQDEVWVQEPYNFIGTVGGSLGLFIGFSYTGFIEKILDYFIRDNRITNLGPSIHLSSSTRPSHSPSIV